MLHNSIKDLANLTVNQDVAGRMKVAFTNPRKIYSHNGKDEVKGWNLLWVSGVSDINPPILSLGLVPLSGRLLSLY